MSVNIVNKSTGALTKIAGNPVEQASGISYDHTSSGMQANNVQAAVDELKSGLTNVDVALSVPEGTGKNFIPLTLTLLKSANTSGVWTDSVYVVSDVTHTVNTDANGNVTSIVLTGTGTSGTIFNLGDSYSLSSLDGNYILTGCPSGGSTSSYYLDVTRTPGSHIVDSGSGANISNDLSTTRLKQARIITSENYNIPTGGLTFYPMVRDARISDATFAPYIPSVDARLEAVESKHIFTSATTGTMKAKLNSIQPYFNALSDEQRRHAYLVHDNNVLFIENTYGARFGSAVRYAASNSKIIFYFVQLNASDSSYVVPSIDTSGFSLEDRSSEENANAVSLYIN